MSRFKGGAEIFWVKQLFRVCLFSFISNVELWHLLATAFKNRYKVCANFGCFVVQLHACISYETIKRIMDKTGHVTLALDKLEVPTVKLCDVGIDRHKLNSFPVLHT